MIIFVASEGGAHRDMGNLIGAVLGKPSKKPIDSSPQIMTEVDDRNNPKSRSRSPILSKRPSLTQIVPICPGGKPVEFTWKHGGNNVILTGSFDNWQQSIPMARDNHNDMWRKTVLLDPSGIHQFKFIVDGVWRCSLDWETATDESGNVNNVISIDK